MWPEVAQISLILAMSLGVFQGFWSLYGAQKQYQPWINLAKPSAYLQWSLIAVAYVILTIAFIEHDFTIEYVANNSSLEQPLLYRISAVWGAHEGSLLFWAFVLASWAMLVAKFSGNIPDAFVARVLAILGLVNTGIMSFMLFTSNPFDRIPFGVSNGTELNPLLQDPGLAFHPPLLYIGYVGFSVAFAFAFAALISGQLDKTLAKWVRPWTTAAWLFLTLGITLGSWWAYYELGWGGWWFWDPVENASFMPWLLGTALIHALAVTERRGTFVAWSILLAITAFSLSLLGTFLVRSGVLTSVHAFANDPERGLYILVLLALVIGSALLLYGLRIDKIRNHYSFSFFSKEMALLMNSIFLSVITFMVLLGTLFPLIFEALDLGKISVGAPYFNTMFIVLALPSALMVGIGAMAKWNDDTAQRFVSPAIAFLLMSIIASAMVSYLLVEQYVFNAFAGLAVSIWVSSWVFWGVFTRIQQTKNPRQPAGFWGMNVAHLGIAVFILGMSHVSAYSEEKHLAMKPGDSFELAGYDFTFNGIELIKEHNYRAQQGSFDVVDSDGWSVVLEPQKRFYRNQGKPLTEAAINTTLKRDLYVSLGEPLQDKPGAWTVRIYYKAYVACIWLGGVLMALGGLIALSDKRYRKAKVAV
jgi:cytochrome c-type biogenesis protein CcmF